MISRFVGAFRAAGLDGDDRSVAEILWLAEIAERYAQASASANADAERDTTPPVSDSDGGQVDSNGENSEQAARHGGPVEGEQRPLTIGDRPLRTIVDRPRRPALYVDRATDAADARLRGSPLKVPGAPALPAAMQVGRALRRLARRHRSDVRFTVDAERTVEQFATTGVLVPVLAPELERWFEVSLIVDTGTSMRVWSETCAELYALLARHGAFRDVRRWSMTAKAGEITLIGESGLTHDWRELLDPSGRRLILVLTDCAAAHWYETAIWETLECWGRQTPVALIDLLPVRLWPSTALGHVSLVARSRMPGLANKDLDVETPWWMFGEPLAGTPIPVFTLEPAAVAAWASVVTGASGSIGATSSRREKRPAPVPNESTATAQERVRRFRLLVSPDAFRLAVYLSAVPLSLPVMRLVHRTMFRQPVLTALAEFMLGDLVRQLPEHEGSPPSYAFYDGVREELQGAMLRSEALKILDAVSSYVETNFGSALDFEALLSSANGTVPISAEGRPFATVGTALLERITHAAAGAIADSGEATPRIVRDRPLRVLVAGTGAYDVSAVIARTSRILGRRLAEDGYWLTLGGWQGVDHIVADAFCSALEHDARGRLRQIVERGRAPDFPGSSFGGEIVEVANDAATFDASADADVAILIGGVGGTRTIAERFIDRGKPVVPIGGTGGDAKSVLDTLTAGARQPRMLSRAFVALLGAKLDSDDAVDAVVDDAAAIVRVVADDSAAQLYERIARALLAVVSRVSRHEDTSATVEADVLLWLEGLRDAALPFVQMSGESGRERNILSEISELPPALTGGDSIAAVFEDISVGGPSIVKFVRELLLLQNRWKPAKKIRDEVLDAVLAAGGKTGLEAVLNRGLQWRPVSEHLLLRKILRDEGSADRMPATRELVRVLAKWAYPQRPGTQIIPTVIRGETTALIECRRAPSAIRYADAAEQHGPFLRSRGDHRLELPGSFRIGKHLVTNRLFRQFIEAEGYGKDRYWSKPGRSRLRLFTADSKSMGPSSWPSAESWPDGRSDFPVSGVCYYEAQAFVAWCNEELRDEAWSWSLPTEDLWEFAARGEAGSIYPWGNVFDAARCNSRESGLRQTSDVDRFQAGASALGCCDMAGNLWEFMLPGNASADLCNMRGGSFMNDRSELRSYLCLFDVPRSHRAPDFGFRVAQLRIPDLNALTRKLSDAAPKRRAPPRRQQAR